MAYHVASLLRQPSHSNTRDIDTHSLRSMTSQIEQFLFMAPQVPAVRMEPAWTASGDNDEGERGAPERGGQPVVELNVVAGVLEACDAAALNGGMTTLTGVLLPTAENQRELHRRKVEQAQAMLNLISALTPSPEAAHSSYGASRESGPSSQEAAQVSPNLSTRVLRHFSSSDSDDGEVAVMDADDLNDEDTSDDDMPAQRRRIQEMN
ncbi:hypothetical protein ABB37_00597 [Leptomonas pyrrhocoris]|uniref:Uncharacterized protein n=1 Tax=Leptomonas pyrrhocoris TaxID=157538 RepID=A0A0M9GAS2_LEPPY|nr:hypothetical protein ABB37_00597 [Leptomonas pyrrhocoris]XP_015664867.1 hypothetical protein ABB37_00597 [Leptomonas pyrrhocoris]KPA86427.1 hypothetical protein ABB37_00597 [Leptomonas pyrrhocoris]KPA86428.1 hypothetical protein ABB37_00597 [Leptomonas pyrrhocoris]|eukprot:XP_015664866.1 hypothetical protein ABB37_00597 [Leptomonas pyrrhocoris]